MMPLSHYQMSASVDVGPYSTAPVTVGPGATIRNGSVLMPGGEMEACSVLLDQSQVLKGETVPAGEAWAGLPAQPAGRHARTGELYSYERHGGGGGGGGEGEGETLLNLEDIPLHEFEHSSSPPIA